MGDKTYDTMNRPEMFREDAGGDVAPVVAIQADCAAGKMQHVYAQLSATGGTVMSITLPAWAQILKLRPETTKVAWALDSDTPAIDAANAGTGDAIDFGTAGAAGGSGGNIAMSDEWDVSILPCDGVTEHVLKLSGAASAYIWVCVRGG